MDNETNHTPADNTHGASLPPDRRALLAGIGGLAAGALLAGAKTAHAGPLNPPPGPIASTGKTLTEVEPRIAINSTNTPGSSATSSIFRITQPGSYYLTGNIIATQINRHVIAIVASGVTIDLNGFLIRGLGTLQGAFDCIFAEANVERVTVRNGHIELAGRHGINLEAVPGCSIESVSASRCLSLGVRVGDSSVVAGCVAYQNSLDGITTGNGCTITNCTARFNGTTGIKAGQCNTITNCSAHQNTGTGIDSDEGCTITNCTARFNGSTGIKAGQCNTITNCSAHQNTGTGIDGFEGCTVTNCTAALNGGTGIDVDRSSTVAHCAAVENGFAGIIIGNGSTVSDCSARRNDSDGVRCANSSVVTGNACSQNGFSGDGAGIQISGANNRIEGNNCAISPRGIRVTSTGNIIIRNTCTGNTIDWEIAANNIYGPIIDRRIPFPVVVTPAVNGTAATSTLGSTDANANFTC